MNSFFSNRKGVLLAGGLFKGGNISQFVKAIEQLCHLSFLWISAKKDRRCFVR